MRVEPDENRRESTEGHGAKGVAKRKRYQNDGRFCEQKDEFDGQQSKSHEKKWGIAQAKRGHGTEGGWVNHAWSPRRIAVRGGGREEAEREDVEAECGESQKKAG